MSKRLILLGSICFFTNSSSSSMSPSSLERLSQEIDHCTSLGEIAEVFERNEHEFEAQLEEIEVRLKYDKARLKLLQGLNTVVIVVTVTTIVATMGNLLFRK